MSAHTNHWGLTDLHHMDLCDENCPPFDLESKDRVSIARLPEILLDGASIGE